MTNATNPNTQLTSQYEKQLEQKTCLIDELLKKVRNITNEFKTVYSENMLFQK